MIELLELENKLNKDGFIVSSFKGTSMKPFLNERKHKVVITKINNANEIKLYDVVLYKNNLNKYILHRCINIKENELEIRGDNTLAIEHVNKNKILGKLIAYYDSDKYIELTDQINYKFFKRSKQTLLYRKAKNKIINILKRL